MTGVVPGSGGTGLLEGHRPGTGVAAPGGEAPTFVAESGEAIPNSAQSFEHTLPPGKIKAGDLVMTLWKTNETSSTKAFDAPPPGWTQGNQDRATILWHKIADGTETTVTGSWTGGASGDPMVHSVVYRNVDPLAPFLIEPDVYASSSSVTAFQAPNSAPAVSDYDLNRTQDQLDNWSSFMEGTSYVGTTYAGTTLALDPSTTRQPNLRERPSTVNTNDVRHWSHEGLTENSGLYNDQRPRWTHSSSHDGGFHAILRAPRTAQWLARTHIAFRSSTRLNAGFDSNLFSTAERGYLDGMLTLAAVMGGNEANEIRAIDTAFATNTWLTAVNSHIYYGTYDAAGRSIRVEGAGTPMGNFVAIANANLSDPFSLALQRSVHTFTPLHNYPFWSRPDQLVIGMLRTGNFDTELATHSGGGLSVERQEYKVDTTAGNQTTQILECRGLTAGKTTTPAVSAPTDWDSNAFIWVGVNHSTESSPILAAPTILGTPTVQTKTVGGPGTFTITKPSGAQVGELLVMMVTTELGGEILSDAPAGFVPIGQSLNSTQGLNRPEFWIKEVDGTEPSTWSPVVNQEGTIVMFRATGILPRNGFYIDQSVVSPALDPHPFPTPTLFAPGIFVRVGSLTDTTARVIDIPVGTAIWPDHDGPTGTASDIHIMATGEVLTGTTPGAADYSITPFPGVAVTSRAYVFHLDAAPLEPSPYTQHMLDLGADGHWSMEGVAVLADPTFDEQVLGTSPSVFFPLGEKSV